LTDWVTIYDVRHIPVVPAWYSAVFGLVVFGIPALLLLRPGTSARTKTIGVGLVFAIGGLFAIGTMSANYYGKLRADLAAGHFVVLDGFVAGGRWETSGRSSAFHFRIENKPFILPEYFPRRLSSGGRHAGGGGHGTRLRTPGRDRLDDVDENPSRNMRAAVDRQTLIAAAR
jgi:hypothetical protein